MFKRIHILYLLLVVIVTSCSGYNKVLKSDDYALKFQSANDYFDKGQEDRSIALYEQVYQRMPKTAEGEVSYYRLGKCYFAGGDYYMAGYYFGQFAQRFPLSVNAEEALFLSALCSVSNSPSYSLDQTETELAINNLQQFVDRYPNSILVDSCNNTIDRLRFKLETKAYDGVKLYSKTSNYRAAVSSALTFIEDFPRSKYEEEVRYELIKNSYLLAKNSIKTKKIDRIDDTIERYRTFVALFPESKYRTMLAKYADLAEKERVTAEK